MVSIQCSLHLFFYIHNYLLNSILSNKRSNINLQNNEIDQLKQCIIEQLKQIQIGYEVRQTQKRQIFKIQGKEAEQV